jgi:nicotinamidase-related amidase
MTSVLLLMDFQNGIAGRPGMEDVVDHASQALNAARGAGVPVIFVRVAFRPGYPEIAESNLSFSAAKAAAGDTMHVDQPGTQILASLTPLDGEEVVVKKRISAFEGSDLQVLLRGLGADHLVLAGVTTSGVVLSTVRRAADLDYRLSVLQDACGDSDDEVHRVLVQKVFPKQAEVMDVADWAATL